MAFIGTSNAPTQWRTFAEYFPEWIVLPLPLFSIHCIINIQFLTHIYIYTPKHCIVTTSSCAVLPLGDPIREKKHAPGTHNAPKTLCIMQLFRMFQNIAFVYYVSEARDIFNDSIGNYECCHSAMAEQWHRTQIKQNAKKSRIRNNVRLQMKCIIINSLKRVTRIHSLSHSLSLSIGTRVFK